MRPFQRSIAIWSVGLIGLWLVACGEGKSRGNLCSSSGECPSGQTCVSSVCVSLGTTTDVVDPGDADATGKDKTTGSEDATVGPFPDAETSECSVDGDCIALLGQLGVCEAASCDKGICKKVPKPDTTPCSDGNGCTEGDHCDGQGACVAGSGKPTCADAGNPCRAAATCVNDGNETYHCDYAADDTKPCNDGNACSIAKCSAGTCTQTGLPLWGSACKTQSQLTGICSESGDCLEPRRWDNVSGQTEATGFEQPGRFVQLLTTDDGKQWAVFLAITPGQPTKAKLRLHPVDNQGQPQSPPDLPLGEWDASFDGSEIQVVCFRQYCVVTGGMFTWDKNTAQPIGFLRVTRYVNGVWSRWQEFETALLTAMSNGASLSFYAPSELTTATMLTTPNSAHFVFGGQIWLAAKQGTLVECSSPCYGPAPPIVAECDHHLQSNELTCKFSTVMDQTYTDGQDVRAVQLMLTELLPFDMPTTTDDVLAVLGMVEDPWYSAVNGFWRMTLRGDGEWSSFLLCDGLNVTAECGHSVPLISRRWKAGQAFTGPQLKPKRRGLTGVHGVVPSELFKVGNPLQETIDAALKATGPFFVPANMSYFKGGTWSNIPISTAPFTLSGETLPKMTILRFNGVHHVNSSSVLIHGTRTTCSGSYLDCGDADAATNQSFIVVYRPQTQAFEPMIPVGDAFVCCDSCQQSLPKCTEPNTNTSFPNPATDRELLHIGARRFTINGTRDRLIFLGHDAYFSTDVNDPSTYRRKDHLLIFVKP